MIFIDASAMVSMIAGETDCDVLTNRLEAASEGFCSAVSIWETAAALCRSYSYTAAFAKLEIESFRMSFGISIVTIGEVETELSLAAYERYGKGRHPAALNMGDCFAYACARSNNAKLLFKGGDFSKTDIATAS